MPLSVALAFPLRRDQASAPLFGVLARKAAGMLTLAPALIRPRTTGRLPAAPSMVCSIATVSGDAFPNSTTSGLAPCLMSRHTCARPPVAQASVNGVSFLHGCLLQLLPSNPSHVFIAYTCI